MGTPAAQAAPGLSATFSAADNGSWWLGKFVIRNDTSAAVESWTLEFDLPATVRMGNSFNGTVTQNGTHVTVANAFYNGRIAPGATTEPFSFSFVGEGVGTPSGCRVNGAKCDGSADVPPTTPSGLRSTGTTTRTVSLAWTGSTGGDFPVAGYDVFAGTTKVASATGTSVTVSGLTPNTTVRFTVRARDQRGNLSAPSNELAVATRNPADDTTAPSVPGGLRVSARTSTSATLAWTASADASGIAGYEVLRAGTVVATATGTSATVTQLSPSTTYAFSVRARDTFDNLSAASATVSVTTDDEVGAGNYARVGYFAQWGIYGRQYFVKDLVSTGAAAKLTHINYAFENINAADGTCMSGVTQGVSTNPQDPRQGVGAGDADADYGRPMSASQSVDGVADTGFEPLRGNFNQLKKLKARFPNLKVLVSLGGWTYSTFFSDVARTDASRQKFVASCIDTFIAGNLKPWAGAGGPGSGAGVFDGIDLDWEWPGSEGHPGNVVRPEDKRNNTLLIQEFRRQLDARAAQTGQRYLLTAFTPADPVKIAAGWELDQVFDSLDFANVQGYDFHGSGSDNSWEPGRTGHQANLFTDTDDPYPFHFSVDSALQVYRDAGVNPRKLTIGIPFYGRGWQDVTAGSVNGAWQAANGAAPGDFAEEAGVRGFKNIAGANPGMTVFHDTQAVATFGFGPNGQWWSFDDPWSIGQKTAYIKSSNLLGAMIWEMSGDTGTLMSALDTGLR